MWSGWATAISRAAGGGDRARPCGRRSTATRLRRRDRAGARARPARGDPDGPHPRARPQEVLPTLGSRPDDAAAAPLARLARAGPGGARRSRWRTSAALFGALRADRPAARRRDERRPRTDRAHARCAGVDGPVDAVACADDGAAGQARPGHGARDLRSRRRGPRPDRRRGGLGRGPGDGPRGRGRPLHRRPDRGRHRRRPGPHADVTLASIAELLGDGPAADGDREEARA